jgi:hypothetical protein
LGHKAKYSYRAYVFRFAPKRRHCAAPPTPTTLYLKSDGRPSCGWLLGRDSSSQTGVTNHGYELSDHEWHVIKPMLPSNVDVATRYDKLAANYLAFGLHQ